MTILITIKVPGEPDFKPYQIDVDAPPPAGTAVEIDGRSFVVDVLTLKSGMWPSGRRSHYQATLRPA